MGQFRINRTIQSFFIIISATIFILTPTMTRFSIEKGQLTTELEQPKAYASLADVTILQIQHLDASYEGGELILDLYGDKLLGLDLIESQYFHYWLPPELRSILSNPGFNDAVNVVLTTYSLLGLELDNQTIDNPIAIVPETGQIVWESTSVLNLSLISRMSAKLTIDLAQLGISVLPSSLDGKLEFYGAAAKSNVITVNLITDQVGYDEISVPLSPPIINPVKDVDNKITGTGLAGATVHITTPTGTYQGVVSADGTYSINIPPQAAGTVITASQTDGVGNISGTSTTTVILTVLELYVPPEIQFENTLIGFKEVLIHRVQEIENLSVTVHDTRGQGYRWTIKAKVENPLTTDGLDALPLDALIFVNDGIEVGKLKDGVTVHQGETGTTEDTPITWGADEGILMKMTPSNVKSGIPYSTTINWTLENAP
ncbi:hypothetical protein HHO41_19760 [Bacillus sp. DNRA2]|uniref:Ig-like domain-containing protein n=1 Tax=Bacillus sp. DNRA2 TaxID=2723053 RepID=UPI00145F7632|nr:Ig-like domain-containing protein [Bacillus sp. DNRA2]NMD72510.1 hypothetical protein [Bacillus sp. DNRA2]